MILHAVLFVLCLVAMGLTWWCLIYKPAKAEEKEYFRMAEEIARLMYGE